MVGSRRHQHSSSSSRAAGGRLGDSLAAAKVSRLSQDRQGRHSSSCSGSIAMLGRRLVGQVGHPLMQAVPPVVPFHLCRRARCRLQLGLVGSTISSSTLERMYFGAVRCISQRSRLALCVVWRQQAQPGRAVQHQNHISGLIPCT